MSRCDYQGYEFGARYLDSVCIDGQLFDADNCDDEGNLYDVGGPSCPQCQPLLAIDGYARDGGIVDTWRAWMLVRDIRRNRGYSTSVWLLIRAIVDPFIHHLRWLTRLGSGLGRLFKRGGRRG